jgi:hypothetical protein
MMKKRFNYSVLAALLVLTLGFTAGCSQGTGGVGGYPSTIENSVYGGLNPMNAWVTITFKAGGKVVGAFSGDNTSNEWDYTYDADTGNGGFNATGWNPGDWKLNSSGNTLTFNNFGGHGNAIEFKQLRKSDLTLVAGPSSGLSTLGANSLEGSVWGGSTPAENGTAFITLTFKAGGEVVASFSHDNSTNSWTYTYSTSGNTGSITGAPWLGNFNISTNGRQINFPNLMGGRDNARSFNRYK